MINKIFEALSHNINKLLKNTYEHCKYSIALTFKKYGHVTVRVGQTKEATDASLEV